MYLKISGAVLIMVCCGGFGMFLANIHRKEVRFLHQLLHMLECMKAEISYRLTPVPLLCRVCAKELSEPVRAVLLLVADELDSQSCGDVAGAFDRALEVGDLPPVTESVLRSLGQTLGRFDLQGQLNGFSQCAQECACQLNELECDQRQRLRSYQTLGFCAGAALVILLF